MNTVNQCVQTKATPQVENLINDIELMSPKDIKGGTPIENQSKSQHKEEIQSLQKAYQEQML